MQKIIDSKSLMFNAFFESYIKQKYDSSVHHNIFF